MSMGLTKAERFRRGVWPFLLVVMMTITVWVHAADLTIHFNGKFIEPTCEWVVGDNDRLIHLDDIDVSQLQKPGLAGAKTFSIGLTSCSSSLSVATFTFSGTSDPTDNLRYQNTGTAKGVAVELESKDGQTIGANGANNARTVPIVGGNAVLDLQAGYWRLGTETLSSGTVKSVALVTATYN